MLIADPRHTEADLTHWAELERYDEMIGATIKRAVDGAVEAIRQFAAAGPCVCSTSWGKDSVVVAHITQMVAPQVPIVWVPTIRSDGISYEAPGTYAVRDRFLARYPDVRYEERPAVARNPKRGDPSYDPAQFDVPAYRSQDVLKEEIAERYISGLRAQESRIRRISVAHRGLVTPRTCRPIARWSAPEVFAYLYRYGLPVHPSYAMTYGGRLDRQWLRVHPLRSKAPARSAVHGWDMDSWEDHYHPTLIVHRPQEEPE